jgi:hypothetical protein
MWDSNHAVFTQKFMSKQIGVSENIVMDGATFQYVVNAYHLIGAEVHLSRNVGSLFVWEEFMMAHNFFNVKKHHQHIRNIGTNLSGLQAW